MKHKIEESLSSLIVPIDSVNLDKRNARTGHDVDLIAKSLQRYGQRTPIVVNANQKMRIEKGNGTYKAAQHLGWSHIAAVIVHDDKETATGYSLVDNRSSDKSSWDQDVLYSILQELDLEEVITGFTIDDIPSMGADPEAARQTLAERFGVSPFSVLNAREGGWQDRKRAWIALGIQSELGRGDNALDISATMAGITDPEERAAWNKTRTSDKSRRQMAKRARLRND